MCREKGGKKKEKNQPAPDGRERAQEKEETASPLHHSPANVEQTENAGWSTVQTQEVVSARAQEAACAKLSKDGSRGGVHRGPGPGRGQDSSGQAGTGLPAGNWETPAEQGCETPRARGVNLPGGTRRCAQQKQPLCGDGAHPTRHRKARP